MRAVLAIDLGTSSCKGALYSEEGERLALAVSEYPVSRPAPHFVEQDPQDYRTAARKVSRELAAAGHEIAAIGFSTQTPTLVFCGESGEALAPAILWEDTRAADEAHWWNTQVDEATRRKWFGMDLPIGAASTPAKLLWIKRRHLETWRSMRFVVQPKDYVAFDLTGRMRTDPWCAKGIGHLATGEVHSEYLALLDKPQAPSPPPGSPTEVAGPVTPQAAEKYGLPASVPVTIGWSDALAGILASGAFHFERRGFVLSGTSEIIGISRKGGEQAKGLYVVPAGLIELRGLELHYGPTQAGGASLHWLCRLFGRTAEEILATLEDRLPESSEQIVFRPYLEGERAPYWDHRLTAGFDGLRTEHGMADLARAVLRGVALQERLVLECAETGDPAREVMLAGGGARDRRWNQLRANVLQRPVRALADPEASLRGAAMLSWGAVEPERLRQHPHAWFAAEEIIPDPGYAAAAREWMERFRR